MPVPARHSVITESSRLHASSPRRAGVEELATGRDPVFRRYEVAGVAQGRLVAPESVPDAFPLPDMGSHRRVFFEELPREDESLTTFLYWHPIAWHMRLPRPLPRQR